MYLRILVYLGTAVPHLIALFLKAKIATIHNPFLTPPHEPGNHNLPLAVSSLYPIAREP